MTLRIHILWTLKKKKKATLKQQLLLSRQGANKFAGRAGLKLGFVWKGVSEFSFGFLNLLEINPDRNTMRKMRLPWIKQLLVCVLLEVLG